MRQPNMRKGRRALGTVLGLVLLTVAADAAAQDWPDGCSINAPGWVEQGLNLIFLDACNRHDLCWAQCNSEFGPYLGMEHRRACDAAMLLGMEAACTFWAPLVTYPLGEIENIDQFLLYCNGVAAPGIYGVLSLPAWDLKYWNTQCIRGCNPDACAIMGLPLPSTCGQGLGPGFCYLHIDPPDPDPFIPPIDPCWFVDCCSGGCSSLTYFCCGGCNYWWDPWGPWWDPWDPWYTPNLPMPWGPTCGGGWW